ncbi:hypothetical protein SEA_SPECKS_55 [Mycobacterium phage Specks]|nr:hypothetical protein AWH68_gp051 [Mycobacterium phage Breeniome]QAY05009.1 hypothetical protein SEA_SHAQNATO_45 [Mycobacterium phage Shaqnato]QAY06726.1 hypothetical protein SEA_PHUSCO_49 [Mycobacterium phage Phusco]QAY09643.1 hypothetical protein SEA_CHARGIE21_45 [Mycobacterium phage Chargie21]QAY09874.1 hypothetical protein PBI_FLABSLAB_46 [Mycobacterium phage Flabslab]QAY10744.1 hypothetical protein SEA_SHIALABEOUF_49 [Mycobacterium phage ShiaLabeouf]QAY13035.1 hypothetical protein SEA_
MTMALPTLTWRTETNGRKKVATTHLRTTYTLEKIDGTWVARVTVPQTRNRIGGGTETLVSGVTFAQARAAALDDYKRNGGN